MSLLDLARQSFRQIKARRNGHTSIFRQVAHALPSQGPSYEKNEINEIIATPSEPTLPAVIGQAASDSASQNGRGAAYFLVRDSAELPAVAQAIEESGTVSLDIETTGLDPHKDRVRLLQLGTDRGIWLIDLFSVDPAPLWAVLGDQDRTLLGANLMFDLPFLYHRHRFAHQGKLLDVVLLSRLLTAGGPDRNANALEDLAARHLGLTLDKTYQKGDRWTGELTQGHLHYAAQDVTLLPQLLGKLLEHIDGAGLKKVADIEMVALPAWVWLACSGAPVDREAWQAQAQQAEDRLAAAHEELIALAPKRQGELPGLTSWNWNKQADVLEALKMLGMEPKSTKDEALAALDHPFAEALRRYRSAAFHVSHYGQETLRWLAGDSRIYAAWSPLGNDAGRSSCKKPNLQGIGKDATLRRCFAAPAGSVLVKADWSQLHLRIVAKMAGEKVMLDAYRRGDDLHKLMARKITGKEDVTKEERQLAKAVNFGLLYGMSAPGLLGYARASYGVTMSLEQAQHARAAFFQLYPAIGRWHQQTRTKNAPETRSLRGRRRLFGEKAWLGDRLNSPVLGTEADGLKLALALLWERREQMPGAFPVLAVHDEIVLECGAEQAEAAAAWLKQAMQDAMAPLIEPVPVEVETTVAQTWGG